MAGVDIHPGAEIGEEFFIDHGNGVVIGETAVIGRNVRIYQAVTLGAKRFEIGGNGELRKSYPRHPIVEDDVVIYAGATILGRITIGRGSSIGGNVWLTASVPSGRRITQAKTRANEAGHLDRFAFGWPRFGSVSTAGARGFVRPVWVFLKRPVSRLNPLFQAIGFPWICLDSLVRIVTYQWVTRDFRSLKFS